VQICLLSQSYTYDEEVCYQDSTPYVGQDKIVLLGGHNGGSYSYIIEVYDVVRNKWKLSNYQNNVSDSDSDGNYDAFGDL
jgi:hypothetical protein